MKKFLNIFIVALGFVVGSAGLASAAKLEGVAVVNMQVLETSAVALKDVVNKITKQKRVYEDEIQSKQSAIEKRAGELSIAEGKKSKTKMEIDKARQKLQEDFMALQNEYKDKLEILESAKNVALEKINTKIREISAKVAKAKGADIVVASAYTFYYNEKFDVTQTILEELNRTTPTVEVEFTELNQDTVKPEKVKRRR